jgi:hypothetical protein
VRADAALPDGVIVQRFAQPSTRVVVAPVRYDPTFTSVTVPLGVRLEARMPGRVPQHLQLTTGALAGGTPLDVTLPEFRGVTEVQQHGRALRRVHTADELDACVDCWGDDGAGGVRVRALPAKDTHTIRLDFDRAAVAGAMRMLAPLQREPAGRASSVLKYGSRAFSARM